MYQIVTYLVVVFRNDNHLLLITPWTFYDVGNSDSHILVKKAGRVSHIQFLGDHLFRFQMLITQWNGDDKFTTVPVGIVSCGNSAVMQLYQRAGQVEADTGAHVAVVDA